MAGLTVTKVAGPVPLGGYFGKAFSVDFDSSYPTGGESLTHDDLGFTEIAIVAALPAEGYTFGWNATTEKLAVYASGGTEVTAATDLSSLTGILVGAFGKYKN